MPHTLPNHLGPHTQAFARCYEADVTFVTQSAFLQASRLAESVECCAQKLLCFELKHQMTVAQTLMKLDFSHTASRYFVGRFLFHQFT